MKKRILLFAMLSILISCVKKEVKIPIVALDGPIEISNNSQIWMFYNEKNKESKLKLNEKNRISTTNWFFNIDKRLTLKEVMPQAQRLLEKHKKKSPHSDGTMKNYFSYVNQLNDKWSFLAFDDIQFEFINKKELLNYSKNKDTIVLDFAVMNYGSYKSLDTINKVVQLAFSEEFTFQKYMTLKANILNNITVDKISRKEIIYTK